MHWCGANEFTLEYVQFIKEKHEFSVTKNVQSGRTLMGILIYFFKLYSKLTFPACENTDSLQAHKSVP